MLGLAHPTRSFIISLVVRHTLHMRIRFALICFSSDMMAVVARAGDGWADERFGVVAAAARAGTSIKDAQKFTKAPRQDADSRRSRFPYSALDSADCCPAMQAARVHQQANMTSSNQIPNLRTLLGPGRGGGLRGRGRGRGGPGSSSDEIRDNAVKGTDQDAAGSRVSCVELGYLHDPYARLFATQPSTRRLPLLNRGQH